MKEKVIPTIMFCIGFLGLYGLMRPTSIKDTMICPQPANFKGISIKNCSKNQGNISTLVSDTIRLDSVALVSAIQGS